MFAQRQRRWASIKTTLDRILCLPRKYRTGGISQKQESEVRPLCLIYLF